MATAQRARHVHGDPDCLVSVRFGDGFGDSVSHTVPFYRGYAPPHAVLRLDLAGRDLTENLMKFPTERECPFATTAERECVWDVKENPCYVGADYDTELKSTAEIDKEETNEIPDGNIIIVGAERFRCVEVLFQPFSRIHGTSFQNNMKCDVDFHKEAYANVVPLGGTAIFQGIVEHMTKELTVLASSTMRSRWLLHPISSTRYEPSRPASSQTETSSLSELNVSVALECFPVKVC